jgi:hypothetical protein
VKTSLRLALMAVAISFVTIAAAGTPFSFLKPAQKPAAAALETAAPFFAREHGVAVSAQPFRID